MRDQFWTYLCTFTDLYRITTTVVVLLAVLSAISYPFVDEGSATHVIIQFNLLILGITFVISGGLFVTCAHKQAEIEDYESY